MTDPYLEGILAKSDTRSLPNDTIPEWAIVQAREMVGHELRQHGMPSEAERYEHGDGDDEVIILACARALVAAERRGLGRAAKHLDQRAREILSSGSITAIGVSRIYEGESAAIRKLMEIIEVGG